MSTKTPPETIEILDLTIKRTSYEPQTEYASYSSEVEGVRVEVSHSKVSPFDTWSLFCRFGPGLGFDVRTRTLPALRQAAQKRVVSTARVLECLYILANTVDEEGSALAGFRVEYFTVTCSRMYAPRQSRLPYDLYVHYFNGVRHLGSSDNANDGSLDRLAQNFMHENEGKISSPDGLFFMVANEDFDKPSEITRFPKYLSYVRISVPFGGSAIAAYGHKYPDALKIIRKDLKKYLKAFKTRGGA